MISDIDQSVRILLSPERILQVRQMIPYILTDDENGTNRSTIAQNISKFNQRRFPNIITNDETWVYYLEPVRNIGNKILQTKQVVAKRTIRTRVFIVYSSHVMV